jgi:hypothetical protein
MAEVNQDLRTEMADRWRIARTAPLLNDIAGPAPSPMAGAESNMVCRAVPTSTSTTLF